MSEEQVEARKKSARQWRDEEERESVDRGGKILSLYFCEPRHAAGPKSHTVAMGIA